MRETGGKRKKTKKKQPKKRKEAAPPNGRTRVSLKQRRQEREEREPERKKGEEKGEIVKTNEVNELQMRSLAHLYNQCTFIVNSYGACIIDCYGYHTIFFLQRYRISNYTFMFHNNIRYRFA